MPSHPVFDAEQLTPWYLVHSKPKGEELAQAQLLAQGYEAWLPLMKQVATGRKARQGELFTWGPLFPRYVFFRPGRPEQSVAPARYTTGVTRLVAFGHILATLSHDRMLELARWELGQHDQDAVTLMNLAPGTRVQITQGPLSGLEALVHMSDTERVVVLLDLIGKQHQISLPVQSVQRID